MSASAHGAAGRLAKGARILFDTNIIMDIATQREGWHDSFAAYDVAALLSASTILSAGATTDIVCLLKSSKYGLVKERSTAALESLMDMFELIDVQPCDVHAALASKMTDYEDALLAFSAERNKCELIITKNVKDYNDSPIRAMSPAEFVDAYKPSDYTYAVVDYA